MADGRPRLVAVGDPPPDDGVEAALEAAPGTSGRGRLPLLLLLVALAVCAFGWIQSRAEALRLSGALAASQQALAAATDRIAAEERRRAAVQDHVSDLRTDAAAFAGRLAELEALVTADLEAADSARPGPRGSAAPGPRGSAAPGDRGSAAREPAADAQVTGNEAPTPD